MNLGDWSSDFADGVRMFIEKTLSVEMSRCYLLLACISPLLQSQGVLLQGQVKNLRQSCAPTTTVYRNHDTLRGVSLLNSQRMRLRRRIEDFEDTGTHTFGYLSLQSGVDRSRELTLREANADTMTLISEARRPKAEVRDFIQVQVSELSLEESGKSIELSSAQILQAKCGWFFKSICQEIFTCVW